MVVLFAVKTGFLQFFSYKNRKGEYVKVGSIALFLSQRMSILRFLMEKCMVTK